MNDRPMHFRYRMRGPHRTVEVVNGAIEDAGLLIWRYEPGAQGMFTFVEFGADLKPTIHRFDDYETAMWMKGDYERKYRRHCTNVYRMY